MFRRQRHCTHNNCINLVPGSTWLRNKANHGSYGFWLGGADRNVLISSEASFNGLPDGHHNSPHLPGNGHAGIVYPRSAVKPHHRARQQM
jgi:hypothetical protein